MRKKKRRRDKENGPEGEMKLRKLSSADDKKYTVDVSAASSTAAIKSEQAPTTQDNSDKDAPGKTLPNKTSAGLGLAGYNSDEDE